MNPVNSLYPTAAALLTAFAVAGGAAAPPPPSPSAPQEQTSDKSQEARAEGMLLSADEIVFQRYDPRTMEVRQLEELVRDLRGRRYWIEEKGGLQGPPTTNLTSLGDALLIMDRRKEVDAILALIEELESLESKQSAAAGLRTLEFRPRYVSLNTLQVAMQSYARQVDDPEAHDRRTLSNMTFVEARSLVLLRDSEERVDEMLRMLTRLDVPEPQVRLTVWVARGVEGEGDPAEAGGLPSDLLHDLQTLLPGFAFESDGYAVVRTSVSAGRGVELEINGGRETYVVALRPQAYDEETGHLSLDRCAFGMRTPLDNPLRAQTQAGPAVRTSSLFETSAVLRAGEYTVLGASGRSPVFLVVRVERVALR